MEKTECRIGICDDRAEDIVRIEEALRAAVTRTGLPLQLVCRSFQNGEDLYAATRRETFDLFFLDIEMPGMDGFELAEKLGRDCPLAYLVFVSWYKNYVYDSPEYSPIWFVRKEALEQDTFKALRKYLRMAALVRISCKLKEGYGFRELFARDIMYIEGSGHSLRVRQTDGSWMKKYGSLKSVEEELEGCNFLRIHKNYLVNQKYIKEVGTMEVLLTNGDILEMGRDRKKKIREAMRRYEMDQKGLSH